ncbi:MAG: TlyA family RNA methyltransferase [Verrucomicrobiaceae bacterium]|nr:TlyA family RNA methyltransferase [Verrucomicrobiaceae bacterium]
MPKERLDILLHQRGLASSREQAKRLILAGEVFMGDTTASKPGQLVPNDTELRVKEQPRFVSRGGLKLEGALNHFGVDVTGLTCLDIGSSTGGFTDCLLQHGAARVYAFDVGTNQLVWKLRSDARVVSRENFNVRHLVPADLPEPIDFIVADVSFISLTLVLPPVLPHVKQGGIVLIKPQFELSRDEVGRGGIVREPNLHQKSVQKLQDFIEQQSGFEWRGVIDSPITGTDGNREFLAWFTRKS